MEVDRCPTYIEWPAARSSIFLWVEKVNKNGSVEVM